MAWARIDDKFLDNPKVRKAGKEATYLYISGLIYSSNQLTEGFISDEALGLVAYKGFVKNELIHTEVLVKCELWDRVEGGYQIHDYLEYNPTKEQIEESRAKKQTAGSKGAQSRWQKDGKAIASAIATASKNDSKTIAKPCDTDGINPSHPIPLKSHDKYSVDSSLSLEGKIDESEKLWLSFSSAFQELTNIEPEPTKPVVAMLSKFQELGVTLDEYRRAIQEMQDGNYTISTMKSPEKWVMNNRNPKKPSSGSRGADKVPVGHELDDILAGVPIFAEDK